MGADATSICSDIFFLVGNANVCPLSPDQTFSNIGFSTLVLAKNVMDTLQEIAITDSLALFKQQVGSLAIEWGTIVNQKAVRSVNTL